VECILEQDPHIETIRVVLDAKLLRVTEVAAQRAKLNRSALIREALRAHLKNLEIKKRELRDCKGYEGVPRGTGDLSGWEAEAIWPEE
jgi:hypothetical protein